MSDWIEIEPAYRSALEAAGLTDFDSFMRAPGGPPTSRHRYRETVPINFSNGGSANRFFLKRVYRVSPAHSLFPILTLRRGWSQPLREWHACGAMADANLPAMRRVAVGERRSAGVPTQAFLLVEATTFPFALEEWLIPGFVRPLLLDDSRRAALWVELGALVRHICDAGFIWPDLHAKHILVSPIDAATSAARAGAGDRWAFCLIDLERVRRVVPLRHASGEALALERDKRVGEALLQLVESLSPTVFSNDDLTNLVAGASAGNPVLQAMINYAAFPRPRLPDDYIHPRRIRYEKRMGMQIDARFMTLLQAAGLKSIDDVFQYSQGELLSKPGLAGHRDRIRLVVNDESSATRTVYLKRYHQPPAREQLRRMMSGDFRRGSARREARFARKLWELGVPTLTTIAFGQQMSGPIERRGFLITDEVPGASLEKLADAAMADPTVGPSPRDKHEIIRQLALLTRRMHERRLFHRDLYLCHVFLSRTASGEIVLRLIDLARMISPRLTYVRWMVKDLAALDYSSPRGLVTRADRARFLYHYLVTPDECRPGRGVDGGRLRRVSRMVEAKSRRIASHDARRRARNS